VTPRRRLFVLFLAVLGVTAIVIARRDGGGPEVTVPASGMAVAADARSGTWFCPGYPTEIPVADTRVTFANPAPEPVEAIVTVAPDPGGAPGEPVRLTVAARSVETRPRAELGGPGALTVEAFGGGLVVEEGTAGAGGADSQACASRSAPNWYFAAGDTVKGVEQWLVVDNPYASDAKVDITLRTSSGVRKADALQGLDIGGRSRTVVPVHEYAVREERVAAEVTARLGRVVVSQVLRSGSDAGATGIMSALGATAPSDDWWFAAGASGATRAAVALVNVGTADLQVDVQAFVEDGPAQEPVTVEVARDDVVWVQLGDCSTDTPACLAVAEGSRYGLRVRADAGGAVVAELRTASADGGAAGVALLGGVTVPAAEWRFARDRVADERLTTVSVLNGGAQPTRVDIVLVAQGREERPPALQGVELAPGRPVTLTVAEGARGDDAAIVVRAGAPVVVERSIATTKDLGRSVGVPVR